MEKTLVIGGSNIEGNVGSCGIKSTSYKVDFWHTETVAINSCNGEVLARNTIFDGTVFMFIPVIFIAIAVIRIMVNR